MSRIAFLSCVRIPYKGPLENKNPPCKLKESEFEQPVWEYLLAQHEQQPLDVVLFLGDQIYSDYGMFNGGGNRPMADNWSLDLFHRLMYAMYSEQYNKVAAFRAFMQRMKDDRVQIGMTWDDHDFGYNNGCGNDPQFANKFASTKVLFEQFRNVCLAMPPAYPPIPDIPSVANPKQGIERIETPITIGNKVDIVLLDARTYRDVQVGHGASLIGPQWAQLEPLMSDLTHDRLMIVCLGSTYSVPGELSSFGFKSSDQSWKQAKTGQPYAHFCEFTTLANAKHILFLTGDIHKNDFIQHKGFCEVISSGAHMPYRFFDNPLSGSNKSRFGILDITDEQVHVKLFADNQIETNISKTISRATGVPI